jgi:predicted NBD/HSP70 family sugar kinase
VTIRSRLLSTEQARHASMIIDVILRSGSQTRADLAECTGLTRSIVSDRVSNLIDLGVLRLSEAATATIGRRPIGISLAPDRGHVLAAVGGFEHLRVGIVDSARRSLAQDAVDFAVAAGPEVAVGQMEELYRRLLAGLSGAGPLLGICIGIPAPVQNPGGLLIAPPDLPNWDGFEVNRYFEERFGAPCWTDNEVNLMAVGEHLTRGGTPLDMIFVKIGRGIGSGIISDGRLHRGADGSAGDIGHNRVPGSTVLCTCSQVGCLGPTAGLEAWLREAERIVRDRPDGVLAARAAEAGGTVAAEDLLFAAEAGDSDARVAIRESGTRVGEALASLVNFFNPAEIVLGGRLGAGSDLFVASLRQAVYARALPIATRNLTLSRSVAKDEAGVTGAAFTALSGLYERSLLAAWGEGPL